MLLASRRHAATDELPAEPAPIDRPPRHTRRGMLTLALGGLAGAVASALGRPGSAQAAAGDPLVIGQQNFGGSAATRLNTTSSGGAFWMTQFGSGSGIRADSVNGHGAVVTTGHADRHALSAQSTGAAGTGAAIRAIGGQNQAILATTDINTSAVIQAINSTTGTAVAAQSQGIALLGNSTDDAGVYGSSGAGWGVYGVADTGYGVYGQSVSSYAGYFQGEVRVAEFVDIDEVATPAAPDDGQARLFARDNGSSKTQLCVIFPGGNVVVLGTSS